MISDEVILKLNEFMPSFGDLFLSVLHSLITGDVAFSLPEITGYIMTIIRAELSGMKGYMEALLILSVVGCLVTRFSGIFKNRQLVDFSYLFIYLGLLKLLIDIYLSLVHNILELVNLILEFTEILIPTFYIAVASNGQIGTANYFYYFTILILYIVSKIFPDIVIPVISVYVFLGFLNGMNRENYFTKIQELLKRFMLLVLKLSLAVISGISVVKSMVFPAVDSGRVGTVAKIVKAIPAIGDVSESVSGIILGSAHLIKDGLGAAILVMLVVIMLAPILKVFLIAAVLKIISAIVSAIGERQIPGSMDGVAEGGFLLVKSALTVGACFFIIIAMVSIAA